MGLTTYSYSQSGFDPSCYDCHSFGLHIKRCNQAIVLIEIDRFSLGWYLLYYPGLVVHYPRSAVH